MVQHFLAHVLFFVKEELDLLPAALDVQLAGVLTRRKATSLVKRGVFL